MSSVFVGLVVGSERRSNAQQLHHWREYLENAIIWEHSLGLANLPRVYALYFLTVLASIFSNQLNIQSNGFWWLDQEEKQILLTIIQIHAPLILASVLGYILLWYHKYHHLPHTTILISNKKIDRALPHYPYPIITYYHHHSCTQSINHYSRSM